MDHRRAILALLNQETGVRGFVLPGIDVRGAKLPGLDEDATAQNGILSEEGAAQA